METFAPKCIHVLTDMFVNAPYRIDLMLCLLNRSVVNCLMFAGPAHKRPPAELKRPQKKKHLEVKSAKRRRGKVKSGIQASVLLTVENRQNLWGRKKKSI